MLSRNRFVLGSSFWGGSFSEGRFLLEGFILGAFVLGLYRMEGYVSFISCLKISPLCSIIFVGCAILELKPSSVTVIKVKTLVGVFLRVKVSHIETPNRYYTTDGKVNYFLLVLSVFMQVISFITFIIKYA